MFHGLLASRGYQIRVFNDGPSDADNVYVFDHWPTGFVRHHFATNALARYDAPPNTWPSSMYMLTVIARPA